jgi:2-polyprenyl-3-methyl-5-hydroxy-6-metoxy-1,4-benzoquinol methylase
MPSHGNKQKHETANPIQRALIRHFHRCLADLVHQLAPENILDVGCGEGYTLRALADLGIRCPMTGIDLSATAVAEARKRLPEGQFEVSDALDVARAGQTYDVVLMTEVLEHIPQPARMLLLLAQVTRRFVIASVPWEPFFRGLNFMRGKHVLALGNDPEHVNHWGRREFLDFMGERFTVHRAPLVFPWTLVLAGRAGIA